MSQIFLSVIYGSVSKDSKPCKVYEKWTSNVGSLTKPHHQVCCNVSWTCAVTKLCKEFPISVNTVWINVRCATQMYFYSCSIQRKGVMRAKKEHWRNTGILGINKPKQDKIQSKFVVPPGPILTRFTWPSCPFWYVTYTLIPDCSANIRVVASSRWNSSCLPTKDTSALSHSGVM